MLVQLTPQSAIIKMTGSDFNDTFNLIRFHFHWGENNFQGSEHYLDGEKFPLEVNKTVLFKYFAFYFFPFETS